MQEFAILTNRKRAVIALAHSVFFLLIAVVSAAVGRSTGPIWSAASAGRIVLLSIFVVVSSILVYLVGISGCSIEKLYFGFCATSASLGLLRTLLGDANLPSGQYLRVLMLICAVITGCVIWRGHSQVELAVEN